MILAEAIKVSAFFQRNWRMTHRNIFTVFEVVFWPVVSLLSVGLMTAFLQLPPETVVCDSGQRSTEFGLDVESGLYKGETK